jgi:Tfp pilus assembly protein PilV
MSKWGLARIVDPSSQRRRKRVWVRTLLGQSLFEVMFAVAVSSLILYAIVSVASVSVRNSNFSKNNSLGTAYAQEGIEYLRQLKDIDWDNLDNKTPTSSPQNLGTLTIWSGSPIIKDSSGNDTIFSRTVELIYRNTDAANDTIEAVVLVTWTDSQGDHQVKSVTRFTNWIK